jgi:hypothetical protein
MPFHHPVGCLFGSVLVDDNPALCVASASWTQGHRRQHALSCGQVGGETDLLEPGGAALKVSDPECDFGAGLDAREVSVEGPDAASLYEHS